MFASPIKSLLVGVALSLCVAGIAQAQSTKGTISGVAAEGETVVVNGPDIGFHREIAMTKDGKFSVRQVPPGTYTVVRIKPDGTAASSQTIVVTGGASVKVM
ncbi:MAG: carboxypeptidase-like regulatory domain-containing protein [Luteimonas sp.]